MLVFLIGYMGSGKSTLGPALALELGSDFVDLDTYIQQCYGQSIPDIFKTEGESRFRELEQQYLAQLITLKHMVIAVGGGTPCFNKNMEVMNANGFTVYLKATAEQLAARLSKEQRLNRPLISNLTDKALAEFINGHLATREQYYQKAKCIVTTHGNPIKELVQQIRLQLF